MRNKRLLWILVMLFLVVGTIAVEAALPGFQQLQGSGGKIWSFFATWFHYKILINTLIISIVIYIALHLIGIKFENKGNKVVGLLIVVLVAYLIVINPVISAGKGQRAAAAKGIQYIWNAKSMSGFKEFFVGKDVGIFTNPSRLGIFIGAFLVFLWLFHFLKVGGGEGFSGKLNIALALVIAYFMTITSGTTVGMIIAAGQIVAILIIFNNLKETFGSNKVWAFVFSLFLVMFITYVAFPGNWYGIFGYLAVLLGVAVGSALGLCVVIALMSLTFYGLYILAKKIIP